MKVFVAGASGVVGLPLTRQLVEAGHEVTGSTRGETGAAGIEEAGGKPVICDVFDREALIRSVSSAAPEVVINQLTSLPPKFEPRKKGYYDANNRIRSEGGDNLIEAAAAAGARRFVTQSISFLYEMSGSPVKTEADPVDRSGTNDAVLEHERKALEDPRFETVVLRYGLFYGPGTWYSRDGHVGQEVIRRRLPIVGAGTGLASFIHVEDAASAALAAVDQGIGIYNVTDDEPAPMNDWLPVLAAALGAKPPRKVPFWLASLVAGRPVARQAVDGRGASNAKFKTDTDWEQLFVSWRRGFQRL